MPQAASARRYAQAVFQIAVEQDALDAWSGDLRSLAEAMEVRELASVLDAPQVPVARKVEAIQRAVGDTVGPLAANLMCVLASKNLANLVPAVLDEYSSMIDARRGIESAEVTSAVRLDDAQRESITKILEGAAGKKVRLHTLVRPEILGGIVGRVGDRVIDGSVRTKLREMRRELGDPASAD
jgi:F-type H+-transporting ATPase subunit delta